VIFERGAVRLGDRGDRGLFIYEVEMTRDRLTIRFFTSRAMSAEDVRQRLHPKDSSGTEYAVARIAPDPIDGKGVIEFRPVPPSEVAWFQLEDRPERALTWARYTGPRRCERP
jgi:hypothetical protein